jgi:hypothetical protein
MGPVRQHIVDGLTLEDDMGLAERRVYADFEYLHSLQNGQKRTATPEWTKTYRASTRRRSSTGSAKRNQWWEFAVYHWLTTHCSWVVPRLEKVSPENCL